MIIYELVVDAVDTWYSLGLFQTVADAISIATARDGIDGQSVSEGGEDGETLFVRKRCIGNFDSCGDTGEDVARITREATYQESTDSFPVWESKVEMLPNVPPSPGGEAAPVHGLVGRIP